MIRPNAIPDSFMLTGMVGLLLSFVFTSTGNLPEKYGYTLGLFFGIMLLSSLVSVTPQLPQKSTDAPTKQLRAAQSKPKRARVAPRAAPKTKPKVAAKKKPARKPAKKSVKKSSRAKKRRK